MIDDDHPDLDRFLDEALAEYGTGDLFAREPTEDVEHEGYLALGVWPMDCRNTLGVRPCPFVGCSSHTLLDYIDRPGGEPALTLSRARLPMFQPPPPKRGEPDPSLGRRRELAPTVPLGSSEDLAFQRRAVERIWELPDTCAREVARRGEHELLAVARVMGADEDEVGKVLDDGLAIIKGAAIAGGAATDDEDAVAAMALALLGLGGQG